MASNLPFKPKKDLEYSIDEESVNKIIQKRFNPKKKQLKFTWEGAKNLLKGKFGTAKQSMERYEALKESKAKEKDYIDFFEEIEKSTDKGLQNLAYAIGDIVTTGIDKGA